MNLELSEHEWAVVLMSLCKHAVLIDWKQLPELKDFTSDDFDCLISKVDKIQKIAWLKEQRKQGVA